MINLPPVGGLIHTIDESSEGGVVCKLEELDRLMTGDVAGEGFKVGQHGALKWGQGNGSVVTKSVVLVVSGDRDDGEGLEPGCHIVFLQWVVRDVCEHRDSWSAQSDQFYEGSALKSLFTSVKISDFCRLRESGSCWRYTRGSCCVVAHLTHWSTSFPSRLKMSCKKHRTPHWNGLFQAWASLAMRHILLQVGESRTVVEKEGTTGWCVFETLWLQQSRSCWAEAVGCCHRGWWHDCAIALKRGLC